MNLLDSLHIIRAALSCRRFKNLPGCLSCSDDKGLPLWKGHADLLSDLLNREFRYLRLSITNICNFRCSYCLPNGCLAQQNNFLSVQEIQHLISAFAELGIEKVRLTGGEPSIRADLPQIISEIKNIKNIKNVALTTNGFMSESKLMSLKLAGLDSMNISVDSLNSDNFKRITGKSCGEQVVRLVDQAIDLGFSEVKINTVLLKNLNDHEFWDFVDWVKQRQITVRFIELMKTTSQDDYFKNHHVSSRSYIQHLENLGWKRNDPGLQGKSRVSGPAFDYSSSDSVGRIGFITPYSENFCQTCNRLRVSAFGALRLCLWGDGDFSIRSYLQSEDQKEELINKIKEILNFKPEAHQLLKNNSGNISSLSAIGG